MTHFFVDRGGTFTDLVALTSDPQVVQRCEADAQFTVFRLVSGKTVILHKLLSENPDRYPDAVIQGIRNILGLSPEAAIPPERVSNVKIGTTVATNALLERKGDPVVLVMTQGLGDALAIGYQNRPDLFALHITKPSLLYTQVIEARERIDAAGTIVTPLDRLHIQTELQHAYDRGIRSCAIVLMHSYRYPQHEITIAEIAREIGFEQISRSSEVSPLIKYIYRGDTTVVDAYLSPLLRRYVEQVQSQLPGVPLAFMQSHGGLGAAEKFQGRDSILSGPAGGIVGAVKTSQQAGFHKIITFDMGGTSTDVAHFAGEYERLWETEIAGVRMRVPSLAIHTVAAGGGSILQFDGQRFQVGPASAGANPGPACYRRGGPLTVTDANLLLGRLQADYFPAVFGPESNLPLDLPIVRQRFEELIALHSDLPGERSSPIASSLKESSIETIAEGFLTIAVENMANAIQKISLQRGYDLEHYTLCCFGGAGGQIACRLAERLGMGRILLHPYAGVLSAYGMGLAEQRLLRGLTIEEPLTIAALDNLPQAYDRLWAEMRATVDPVTSTESTPDCSPHGRAELEAKIQRKIDLKYEGTDTSLSFEFSTNLEALQQQFDQQHQQRYGFLQPEKALQIASISLEYIEPVTLPAEPQQPGGGETAPIAWVKLYSNGHWHPTPVYDRRALAPQQTLTGPALILEGTGTIVLEPGWQACFGHLTDPETLAPKRSANLILERIPSPPPLG
ncbi:MAG: hydantoinase/oxoprolinase family protein, partial [Prochlorotrichaceae cyanobacterium]